MLKRWEEFTRFLSDGRICLTNKCRPLIVTAKLNDVDPRAWLADVLARIGDHPASHLDELPNSASSVRSRHLPRPRTSASAKFKANSLVEQAVD